MSDLVVNDEQAKILSGASAPIAIRDQSGKLLGFASPDVERIVASSKFTREQIAELEKRLDSDEPWLTTGEILQHIRSLGDS